MNVNNRIGKVGLVFGLGLFMALAAINNGLSAQGAYGAVAGTVGMQGTFGDPMVMWRAIDSSFIVWTAVILIVLTEAAAGIFLMLGAFKLWKARSSASDFNAAKSTATTGCLIVACFYLIAFGAVCQEWFMLWQNADSPTLQEAFRNFSSAMLVMMWLNTADQ